MSMQNRPINHHFVPQHFLKAWEIRNQKNKVFRYKKIESAGRFECKQVSLKKTSSIENLYDVVLPDGEFEIESSVVTPKLDEVGHKVLNKVRSSSIYNFDENEKKELAIYFTCLEARHPEILDSMNVVPELNRMSQESIKEFFGDGKLGSEIADYFKGAKSTGSISLSAFIQNERTGLICEPFSSGLLKVKYIEVTFDNDILVSSDYPVSRFGDYQGNLQVVVAVSPKKAIIYTSSSDIGVFSELPRIALGELINVYTLMNASCGYYNDATKNEFIAKHLSWSKCAKGIKDKKKYIYDFVVSEMLKYA